MKWLIWVYFGGIIAAYLLIMIRVNSRTPKYIGHRNRPGWSGSHPFYRVYCPEHGYYEDYPHGLKGYFTCPRCLKERIKT